MCLSLPLGLRWHLASSCRTLPPTDLSVKPCRTRDRAGRGPPWCAALVDAKDPIDPVCEHVSRQSAGGPRKSRNDWGVDVNQPRFDVTPIGRVESPLSDPESAP